MCDLLNVLTIREAAQRLRICERTCMTLIKSGRLAATRITPFTVRITEKSIQEFLLDNTDGGTPAAAEPVTDDVLYEDAA